MLSPTMNILMIYLAALPRSSLLISAILRPDIEISISLGLGKLNIPIKVGPDFDPSLGLTKKEFLAREWKMQSLLVIRMNGTL